VAQHTRPSGRTAGRSGGRSRPPLGSATAAWHSCPVEETQQDTQVPEGRELSDLVGEWLDWSEAGERLHLSTSKVRQLIREHQLAAAVPVAGAGQQVPAELIQDGLVVKGVPGVCTVLHDGGYDDPAIIAWLFTADDTLPGRPIDALRENRGAEVKRRAQAMAF
jgi:Rv2175c C-terminal domain of unknown function